MKALPVKLTPHDGYAECPATEATHLTLFFPGPTRRLTLPVIQRGARAGTNCWTWNGSVDAPTLRPSVLTQGHSGGVEFRCHSWVNDGRVQFLDDCSHELRNQTVELLPVHGSNAAAHATPERSEAERRGSRGGAGYVAPEQGR